MQRVAIVGDGPAALSTAERLIGAGMCVWTSSAPSPPVPPRACAFSATCAWAKAARQTSPPASSASWPHTATAAFSP